MITKIEVDGFKSLRNFDLGLKPGLNILVGPNGAGKTNIILFFEFLSQIINQPIGNAISAVGGAGAIFQKIGEKGYSDCIKCKIYGSSQIENKKYMNYEYSFEIKISFEKDNVYFSKQQLKIKNTSKFWGSPDLPRYTKEWDFDIECDAVEPDLLKPKITVNSYNRDKIETRFLKTKSKADFTRELDKFITNASTTYYSLITATLPLLPHEIVIYMDLKGGETFNIVPSKVRELEDTATPPGIKRDGSGLATTLYAMKKSRSRQPQKGLWYALFDESQKTYDPQTLNKIIEFLKAANSTVTGLDVDNDPFNNKLMVKVTVKSGDYEAVLPLSSMSDGTIKWLTLITAILTSKTIFSIEEPENFLHPWMQAEIAKIMRNHLLEKESKAFVLMTTHSESLLNNVDPEEIIIVDLLEGKTKARRISNVSGIKDEISNSGFGLGHFYFSNALC